MKSTRKDIVCFFYTGGNCPLSQKWQQNGILKNEEQNWPGVQYLLNGETYFQTHLWKTAP